VCGAPQPSSVATTRSFGGVSSTASPFVPTLGGVEPGDVGTLGSTRKTPVSGPVSIAT
jgi:hypothetical protein